MDKLETLVKESLIRRDTERNYAQMTTPQFKAMVKASADTLISEVFGAMGVEKDASMAAELDTVIGQMMTSPEYLTNMATQNAQNNYKTMEDVKGMSADILKKHPDMQTAEFLVELQNDMGDMKSKLEKRDLLMQKYVTLAKQKGVEYLLTDDAEREVVTSIYPSVQEYIDSHLEVYAETLKFIEKAVKSVTKAYAGSDEAKMLGGFMSGLQKVLETTSKKLYRETVVSSAKRIYGYLPN